MYASLGRTGYRNQSEENCTKRGNARGNAANNVEKSNLKWIEHIGQYTSKIIQRSTGEFH